MISAPGRTETKLSRRGKMDVTQTLLYMTCLCLARDLVSCDDYEETGKDITLTPNIRGHPAEILWKHNKNKVLEYDGSEVVEYGPFRGRVVVDFETGQLTIRKLNGQDSGQYQCDIVINGNVQTSSHTVTVLDALPEPKVTCEPYESSNASKKLVCSVESQTQPSYQWSGPNINAQSGAELLVEEQEGNRDSVYTCTVRNQANSKSADFTLRDCPIGRAGSAVLASVLVIILLILLILLAVFIYRRKKQKQARQSEPSKMDPENGEDQDLLRKDPTDVMAGSSDATLPSHNRLPSQKESIANKKWERDNGGSEEEQKLLKERLLENNLKQSPQSVSETNQEDKEQGHEGKLDQNKKNSESAVEAEENTYISKRDETEKESHTSLQSQEGEGKERIQIQKRESGDGEKSPEHQNERLEDNEDNQTEETSLDTGEGQILLRNEEKTCSKPYEIDKESDKSSQSHEEEEKERIQIQKQERGDGEMSTEHQNEKLEEQKTEDDEDNQTGETIDRRDTETETMSPQSAVTEKNHMDTENEEGQLHENEKSQSDDDEQSRELQNENKQKNEDAADSEDDMRPGEQNERNEEQNYDGIDRANTDGPCNEPAVDHSLDGEAPSAPADLPANLEKEPINSSASSSNQTQLCNNTGQDKEEERQRPGLEQDEEEMFVRNQEQKDGQEQMAEEKDPEISVGKQDFDKQDKQADPDRTQHSAYQRDEAVTSDMTDKDQSGKLIDDHAKVVEGETEVQTQQEDGGQREQDMTEVSQK